MTGQDARIVKFRITAKNKKAVHTYPRYSDFSACFDSYMDPDSFFSSKGLSLYSYDKDFAQVLYVDGTNGEALKQSPFIYQTQYQNAEFIYRVPISLLTEPKPGTEKDRIFVFSTGRCGSTLLNNLLKLVPDAACLSEPDYPYLLVQQHFKGWPVVKDPVGEMKKVIPNLILGREANEQGLEIIKLRSQCILIADKIRETFPSAKFIFMYREPSGWFRSASRAFGSNLKGYIHHWQMYHRQYEVLTEQGAEFALFDYDALLKDPVGTFNRLLIDCDIPFQATEEAVMSVMNQDSQAGTALDKMKTNLQKGPDSADLEVFLGATKGLIYEKPSS